RKQAAVRDSIEEKAECMEASLDEGGEGKPKRHGMHCTGRPPAAQGFSSTDLAACGKAHKPDAPARALPRWRVGIMCFAASSSLLPPQTQHRDERAVPHLGVLGMLRPGIPGEIRVIDDAFADPLARAFDDGVAAHLADKIVLLHEWLGADKVGLDGVVGHPQ